MWNVFSSCYLQVGGVMRKFICLFVLVGILALGAGISYSVIGDHHHSEDTLDHSGRLDKCGGHTNRKTGEYHYHRGPYCNHEENQETMDE